MGTIDWGKLRAFAAIMFVIGVVSATTMIGCGGGGSSDGGLCEQCGATDGPCIDPTPLPPDAENRPAFCVAGKDCNVTLRCVRKIDSAQRRCFPGDATNNGALDVDFECDGSRPEPLPSPTETPTPTATPIATGPTLTPSATAVTPTPTLTPSATAVTPTPTPTLTVTTPPTATPGVTTVNITVQEPEDADPDAEFTRFTATVTYPAAKGTFTSDGATTCDETDGFSFDDNGNGTLTLHFSVASDDSTTSADIDCDFHEKTTDPLVESELGGEAGNLEVSFDL